MEYLINIMQGDIQYFFRLMVVGLIYAILNHRVEVIIKITTEKTIFTISILKKNLYISIIRNLANTCTYE